MFPLRQLAAALANVQLTSAHGPWSRAIGYRYLLGPPPGLTGPPQPLWGGAAKLAGARFTPQGAFDSIYLAHDPITAFIEVSALVLLPGGPVPVRSAPWVVVTVDGILNSLLDLTDPAILAALGTTSINGITTSLPSFVYLGATSATAGAPGYFQNGVFSTGGIPVAITLTANASMISSGTGGVNQPWFALIGA